jgi:small subunit ribosomal protein S4
VNIPSYQVSVNDEIAVREGSKEIAILAQIKELTSHQSAPTWLNVDRDNWKGNVLALPKRDEIQMPVNEQLIVELYSK